MRMCKKQVMSVILTLTLISGCFMGTGVSVRAAGSGSILQSPVVDEKGSPVSGAVFVLKKTSSSDEIAATITSKNGRIEYDVKDLEDGTYQLKAADDSDYTWDDYYAVIISGGIISAIKDWTDKPINDVRIEVEKKADPAKQIITIKLVDEPGGNPVDASIALLKVTQDFGSYGKESTKEKAVNGEYTYIWNANDPAEGVIIELHPDVTGYEADPIEFTISSKGEIQNYDKIPREMVVTKIGLTANITKVGADLSEIPSKGGAVKLTVESNGTTTARNWGVKVQSFISGTAQKPGSGAGQATVEKITKNTATVRIPENKAKDRIEYVFSAGSKDEDGNIADQASVKVTQAGKATASAAIKVTGIKLSAVSKKIAAGKKVKLTAEVLPANASNKGVTYKSSNPKYATVDASGKVTAKKAGAGKSVTITAVAADGSGKSASYKLTIMKNAVKSVKVKAAKSVKAGKKVKAKATVKTTGKKVNKKLKWTSSNTKYATVSSKGVIKTKKDGKGKTVKITAAATDGSGKKGTVKIKIK